MFIPLWLVVVFGLLFLSLAALLAAIVRGRNPLPFPDNGSRIFATPGSEAKRAIVDLMAKHGVGERFKVDTADAERSILWDGTIINTSSPEMLTKLKSAPAAIGLVAIDPEKDAQDAVNFLSSRGFQAEILPNVEPGLPIVFVLTDALSGAALNFRPHITRMPRPQK